MAQFSLNQLLANWPGSSHCKVSIFMEERTHLDPAQQPGSTGDMDPEAFRHYGHQVIDWMADYLQHASTYPVLAQTAPGAIRRAPRSTSGTSRSVRSHPGRF